MADVTDYPQGTLFTARVLHNLAANPDRYWHNTYELRANVDGGLPELQEAMTIVASFERAIHLSGVYFAQYTIGTWTPDSVPYNPNTFYTGSLNAYGTRPLTYASADTVDLDLVLWVTRQLLTGRNGKLFYRGCLVDGDIQAPSGDVIIDNDELLTTVFAAAKVSSGIGDLFTGGSAPLHLVSITANGGYIREVQDFEIRGATINKNDHKYFDVA